MKNHKGLSLVELMIIIAIIGILLSVAIPQWQKYTRNSELKTAAREIAGDFFNMKQRAVGETANYRIEFDTNNNSYVMKNADTSSVIGTRNLSDYGAGITISGITFSGHAVDFYSRGTAESGHLDLRNSIGSTATITVNITGRTHVSFTMQ
ncbi:MAG: prepilin-type N-terminal cleavage/methylation domain-containing protein [Syntrophaceae bacterium]|nr:prepilin-type N-terminal cleavage/methylation domain-containing protein [Syntrophaceae bacterium]